jgi:hypothetical protein
MAQTRADYGTKGILSFINPDFGLNGVNNMWADCPLAEWVHDPTIGVHWFDHFESFVTTQKGLTSVVTDGGSATSTVGSFLTLNTVDATDNDETYVGASVPGTLLAAGKDIWFEARVRLTEANVDDANIIIGLSSLYSSDILVNNGAGPAADYSGIVFFKVDGGTVWQVENSTDVGGGTQTTLTSVAAFTTGATYRLGFRVFSNTMITWYINGIAVGSSTTNFPTTAMGPLFGVKNGDTNAEILYVDWFRMFQLS